MPRRGAKHGSAWELHEQDLPDTGHDNTFPLCLLGIDENAIFRWLTLNRRCGRLGRMFHLSPWFVAMLWMPVIVPLSLQFLRGFVGPQLFHVALVGALAVFVAGHLLRALYFVWAPRPQRGVLMELTESALRDLALSELDVDDVLNGIWAHATRHRRRRAQVITLGIVFVVLLPLTFATLKWIGLLPFWMWLLASHVKYRRGYPFAELPRIHRIVRQQADWVRDRGRPFRQFLRFSRWMLRPFIWGGFFGIIYIVTLIRTGNMLSDIGFENAFIYGTLTVEYLLIAYLAGRFRARSIINNYRRYHDEIRLDVQRILGHYWNLAPAEFSPAPEVRP